MTLLLLFFEEYEVNSELARWKLQSSNNFHLRNKSQNNWCATTATQQLSYKKKAVMYVIRHCVAFEAIGHNQTDASSHWMHIASTKTGDLMKTEVLLSSLIYHGHPWFYRLTLIFPWINRPKTKAFCSKIIHVWIHDLKTQNCKFSHNLQEKRRKKALKIYTEEESPIADWSTIYPAF